MSAKRQYRLGVVGVFVNAAGQVLICQRGDLPECWQFPQGGIDEGESAEVAVLREMKEELGIGECCIRSQSSEPTQYRFPHEIHPYHGEYIGQQQWWFAMELPEGEEPDMAKGDGEFTDYRWALPQYAVATIIEWKRDAYIAGLTRLGLLEDGDVETVDS